MSLPVGLGREGVDDPEPGRVGAESEPDDRAGFVVGELDGAGEERSDLIGCLGLRHEPGDEGDSHSVGVLVDMGDPRMLAPHHAAP